MKQIPQLKKMVIPIIAIVVGLMVGLMVSHLQLKKEQKIFQDKMKENSKRIAFMDKKNEEAVSSMTLSMEQKSKDDLDKFEKLHKEKNALAGQLRKLKDEMPGLETKIKESEATSGKIKKEFQEMEQKNAQATERNKELDRDLKKITGEKQALLSDLKKIRKIIDQYKSNNAELCIIADELVKKYRNKGVSESLLEKEPLLQMKKVELEQLTQKYKEEIEQLKIKQKSKGD